jgi:hypothetical protein
MVKNAVSDWLSAHGGMPLGSWLGHLVFILFINDLLPSCLSYKYIDDLTLCVFLHEDDESKMSVLFKDVFPWSDCKNMNVNIGKTKEMLIGSCKQGPDLLCLNRADCIERVHVCKLKSWCSNQLYSLITGMIMLTLFVLRLTRDYIFLNSSKDQVLTFLTCYCTITLSLFLSSEWCCPAWHTGLTKQQSHHIESIQKRAFSIIFGMSLRGIFTHSSLMVSFNL